jgi:hypothetical protein
VAREGYHISPEAVATLNPYLREKIKRFGEYVIDTVAIAPQLNPDKPFLIPDIGWVVPSVEPRWQGCCVL